MELASNSQVFSNEALFEKLGRAELKAAAAGSPSSVPELPLKKVGDVIG
jgi:hypothetical protein